MQLFIQVLRQICVFLHKLDGVWIDHRAHCNVEAQRRQKHEVGTSFQSVSVCCSVLCSLF